MVCASSWTEIWTPEKVVSSNDPLDAFANYVQQTVGTPYPTGKDMNACKKWVKEFFAKYPQLDYYTLCDVAQWARSRKKRPVHLKALLNLFRYAWSDGALPQLDPANIDQKTDEGIRNALMVETDESWCSQFYRVQGAQARQNLLMRWTRERSLLV